MALRYLRAQVALGERWGYVLLTAQGAVKRSLTIRGHRPPAGSGVASGLPVE